MDRLLVLRLSSIGCAAEAFVNDVPVARSSATGGSVSVAVHELLAEGDNEITLVAAASPGSPDRTVRPLVADTARSASIRLLLPRVGHQASELSARSLAEIDWAVAEGELHRPPVVVRRSVSLPVRFPRWRWMDVPPIDDSKATQALVAEFVQSLAVSLAKGDADAFVSAARVRFEDLAQAYQRPVAELVDRWRARIQLLYATKALKLDVPAGEDVVLRRVGGGRLAECVLADGEAALRTGALPDGSRHAWPIRVAVIEGRCHVMR